MLRLNLNKPWQQKRHQRCGCDSRLRRSRGKPCENLSMLDAKRGSPSTRCPPWSCCA